MIVPTSAATEPVAPVTFKTRKVAPPVATTAGWPFDAAEAARRQTAPGQWQREIKLTNGLTLKLVLIPAGALVTASNEVNPSSPAKVSAPFWMGQFEVSNEQFAQFDPAHDSRIERGDFLQFSVRERGYPVNGPRQPVVRVSWQQALDFCRWLSAQTGEHFSLPTETQWEWACRAGSATPMWFGDEGADFSAKANLADRTFKFMPALGWGLPQDAIPPYRPAVETVDDRFRVTAPVGNFQPNSWGLHDMHGNVAEWTLGEHAGLKVVRGGSFADRPACATAGFRQGYPGWQKVFNVGFRVVCDAPAETKETAKAGPVK
jgi:formylglycine-generating enzyme required for sulfatase activity